MREQRGRERAEAPAVSVSAAAAADSLPLRPPLWRQAGLESTKGGEQALNPQ